MNLEEGKEYQLTKELMPLLNLTAHSIKTRKEDLLIWFENFFDFEIVKQKPFTIKILKIKEEYQPLPRKVEKNQLTKERKYDEFTYQALGEEFEPNSKSRVARQAIYSFGSSEFGHHDYKKVVERYVSKPFNKYAETNNEQVWVWYSSYKEPNETVIENWRTILFNERIDEKNAASAFYRQEQGEDITDERDAYQRARDKFRDMYGDTLVLVKKWKNKEK